MRKIQIIPILALISLFLFGYNAAAELTGVALKNYNDRKINNTSHTPTIKLHCQKEQKDYWGEITEHALANKDLSSLDLWWIIQQKAWGKEIDQEQGSLLFDLVMKTGDRKEYLFDLMTQPYFQESESALSYLSKFVVFHHSEKKTFSILAQLVENNLVDILKEVFELVPQTLVQIHQQMAVTRYEEALQSNVSYTLVEWVARSRDDVEFKYLSNKNSPVPPYVESMKLIIGETYTKGLKPTMLNNSEKKLIEAILLLFREEIIDARYVSTFYSLPTHAESSNKQKIN